VKLRTRFTKQGKLVCERNNKKALMGVDTIYQEQISIWFKLYAFWGC